MTDAPPPSPVPPADRGPARRGRLKIFLGAAPGVGKTYEMLSDGGERLRAGADVAAVAIDTHGRPEAAALLAAFADPIATVDLDAIIARRPALVLVDDLHVGNPAGARHPRRWQDVDELIAAGVDVYTTLNIQHVESVSDVVAEIARIGIADTVPDSVFEAAEIEVVDLPPDELIRRLEEGKVHLPNDVARAQSHYFSLPVLSALREMVLRRAVLSVDRQMLAHLDASDDRTSYAAGERVLVAVNELPGVDGLVRAAKRLADALHAPWAAIYIETPRAQTFGEAQKRRVADALRLASTLGATIATVAAETVKEGLIAQVEALHATQLVIGKSRRSWWFTLRHGSVVEAMLRASEGLAVHVLPGADRAAAPATPVTPPGRWGSPGDYAAIAAFLAITSGFGLLIEPMVGLNAMDLLYLLPVIASAALFGGRPGLVAGVFAALLYNFLFIEPRGALSVRNPEAGIALVALLAISAFTARITERLRTRATLGLRNAQQSAAVAAFAQTLARVSDRTSTAEAICAEVSRMLALDVMLLADRVGTLAPIASYPAGLTLGPVDQAAAEWVHRKGEPAGAGSSTMSAADWLFVPLKTSLGTLAVLGLASESGRDPVPADQAVLMSALVGQAALAHERLHLEDDVRDVSVLKERDRLRVALLSSLARDLAAPLAAMTGALDEAARADEGSAPLAEARRSARRMRYFLSDLAELVEVEQGTLVANPEPLDLAETVSAAAHDIRDVLREVSIDLAVPGDMPRVNVDARLLRHVLANLMGSAAARGAPTVRIEGRRTPDALLLVVTDQGRAVSVDPDRPVGGEMGAQGGLGVAIVRGFADAIGVEVSAEQGGETGRIVTLRFPAALIAGEPRA